MGVKGGQDYDLASCDMAKIMPGREKHLSYWNQIFFH